MNTLKLEKQIEKIEKDIEKINKVVLPKLAEIESLKAKKQQLEKDIQEIINLKNKINSILNK